MLYKARSISQLIAPELKLSVLYSYVGLALAIVVIAYGIFGHH